MGIFSKIGSDLKDIRNGLGDAGTFLKDHIESLGDDICPNIPDPYMEKNTCGKELNEEYTSQYSCSNVDTHSVAAKDFCDQFGYDGEWDYESFLSSLSTPCQVSLNHPFSKGEFPCLQSVGVGLGVASYAAVGIGLSIAADSATVGLATPVVVGIDAGLIGAAVGAFAGTGVGVKCRRKKFNGDPLRCCLQDFACSGKCWEDNDSKKPLKTCNPIFRDAGGSDCQSSIRDYCLAVGGDTQDLVDRWTTKSSETYDIEFSDPSNPGTFITKPDPNNPGNNYTNTISFDGVPICQAMLYRNMYKNTISIGCSYQPLEGILPDPQGSAWARDLIGQMVQQYMTDSGDSIIDPTPSPMINAIEKICRTTPGLCDPFLKSYCKTFSEDEVNRNPLLSKWCGCHLSQDHYDQYLDQFGINKACTPLCHTPGTIPSVGDNGYDVLKCDQQVCMIDNLTIEAIKGRIGDVNITDVCSGCIDCQCMIVDNTIIELESQIGKLSIVNQCSGTSSGSGPRCVSANVSNSIDNTTTADTVAGVLANSKNHIANTTGTSKEFDCHSKDKTTSSSNSTSSTNSSSESVRTEEDLTVLAYSGVSITVIIFLIVLAIIVNF